MKNCRLKNRIKHFKFSMQNKILDRGAESLNEDSETEDG